MEKINMKIKRLSDDAQVPQYQTKEAAGADLHACIKEPVVIQPGAIELVPTGIAFEIPVGYEVQLRPRSGLALKHGITLPNSPATIDSDYRGEIKVIMMNLGQEPFRIENGERIAQMVVARHETAEFTEVSELGESIRGENAFGSTGK